MQLIGTHSYVDWYACRTSSECVYIKQNHVRGGTSSPGSTHLYSPPARLISVGEEWVEPGGEGSKVKVCSALQH